VRGRRTTVVIRGGGDLGSGVAARLARSGYGVVVLETAAPAVVRRTVAFAEAVFAGKASVEDLVGELMAAGSVEDRFETSEPGRIAGATGGQIAAERTVVPVVVDPDGGLLRSLRPAAVVDARMAKRNLGTTRDDAPMVVALGPGFEAGVDCDAVVETNRGHSLGRVLWSGHAESDTGIPAPVLGVAEERLVRSPATGTFRGCAAIGDLVATGDVVGTVVSGARDPGCARDDVARVEARVRTSGMLRGLIADGVVVREGQKIGDVDPRGSAVDPAAISDKALAVGGGVLEALLAMGVEPTQPD